MKKLTLVLMVIFFMASVSFALTINEVVDKDAYVSDGIQATMVRKIDAQNRSLTIEGKFYMKDKKSRANMKLTEDMVGSKAQLQRLEMMGMTNRVTISVDKDQSVVQYMIFPDNKAYIERTTQKNEKSFNIDDMLNRKIEKVGKVKFNNLDTTKYKELNPDENVKESYIYVKDNLIIGSETTYTEDSKTNKIEIFYKDIKKGVDDSHFNIPENYQKFSNMRSMMQSLMQDMQG
jgi:hypothetical protein